MRALFALLLIVAIGNPVCCCVFANAKSEKTSLLSCCEAHLGENPVLPQPEGKEVPPISCPCDTKMGLATGNKVFAPAPLPVNWFPLIPVQNDLEGLDARGYYYRLKAPPASAFLVAEPPAHRILFGVFRC